MEPTKACSCCATEKPLSEFYFRKDSQKYRSGCIKCFQKDCKARHKENATRDNALVRAWHREHREQQNTARRIWHRENRERVRVRRLAWRRKPGEKQEKARLAHNIRTRTRHALKGAYKSETTFKLLGCTLDFFRAYLEKQFVLGMSWENYGRTGWHVDHRKPCTSFNLTDPAQQRECFHYTNLQPLWSIDNIKKGNKNA